MRQRLTAGLMGMLVGVGLIGGVPRRREGSRGG